MAAMGFCPSGRVFEAAACGAPIISDAWLGLDTIEDVQHPKGSAHAHLLRLAAEGEQPISEEVNLPTAAEAGAGPTGAAAKLACPAVSDCWLATLG